MVNQKVSVQQKEQKELESLSSIGALGAPSLLSNPPYLIKRGINEHIWHHKKGFKHGTIRGRIRTVYGCIRVMVGVFVNRG